MTSSDTLSAARVPRWRRCRLPGRAPMQKPLASLDLISGGCLSSAIAPGLYRPPSYSLDALRADLNRFTFLLGGNDREFLLGEDPPNARNRTPRLRSLLANKNHRSSRQRERTRCPVSVNSARSH